MEFTSIVFAIIYFKIMDRYKSMNIQYIRTLWKHSGTLYKNTLTLYQRQNKYNKILSLTKVMFVKH
jgi:hypothetical protein